MTTHRDNAEDALVAHVQDTLRAGGVRTQNVRLRHAQEIAAEALALVDARLAATLPGGDRHEPPWHTLDPARPLASLRDVAREETGLTQKGAAELLGYAHPSGVTSPEQRGASVEIAALGQRGDAYGYEVEIRVRRRR
jgi:hypothetical protein